MKSNDGHSQGAWRRAAASRMLGGMQHTLICEAISRRVLLEFQYRGRYRVVAPYCHGVSARGVEVLRAVQLRGSSSSDGFGFGKLWTVGEIQAARLTSESFVPDDPQYNPNDTAMTHIHCRV